MKKTSSAKELPTKSPIPPSGPSSSSSSSKPTPSSSSTANGHVPATTTTTVKKPTSPTPQGPKSSAASSSATTPSSTKPATQNSSTSKVATNSNSNSKQQPVSPSSTNTTTTATTTTTTASPVPSLSPRPLVGGAAVTTPTTTTSPTTTTTTGTAAVGMPPPAPLGSLVGGSSTNTTASTSSSSNPTKLPSLGAVVEYREHLWKVAYVGPVQFNLQTLNREEGNKEQEEDARNPPAKRGPRNDEEILVGLIQVLCPPMTGAGGGGSSALERSLPSVGSTPIGSSRNSNSNNNKACSSASAGGGDNSNNNKKSQSSVKGNSSANKGSGPSSSSQGAANNNNNSIISAGGGGGMGSSANNHNISESFRSDSNPPVGNCNGTVDGTTYFICDENRGRFARLSELVSSPTAETTKTGHLGATAVGSDEDVNSSSSNPIVFGASSIRRLREEGQQQGGSSPNRTTAAAATTTTRDVGLDIADPSNTTAAASPYLLPSAKELFPSGSNALPSAPLHSGINNMTGHQQGGTTTTAAAAAANSNNFLTTVNGSPLEADLNALLMPSSTSSRPNSKPNPHRPAHQPNTVVEFPTEQNIKKFFDTLQTSSERVEARLAQLLREDDEWLEETKKRLAQLQETFSWEDVLRDACRKEEDVEARAQQITTSIIPSPPQLHNNSNLVVGDDDTPLPSGAASGVHSHPPSSHHHHHHPTDRLMMAGSSHSQTHSFDHSGAVSPRDPEDDDPTDATPRRVGSLFCLPKSSTSYSGAVTPSSPHLQIPSYDLAAAKHFLEACEASLKKGIEGEGTILYSGSHPAANNNNTNNINYSHASPNGAPLVGHHPQPTAPSSPAPAAARKVRQSVTSFTPDHQPQQASPEQSTRRATAQFNLALGSTRLDNSQRPNQSVRVLRAKSHAGELLESAMLATRGSSRLGGDIKELRDTIHQQFFRLKPAPPPPPPHHPQHGHHHSPTSGSRAVVPSHEVPSTPILPVHAAAEMLAGGSSSYSRQRSSSVASNDSAISGSHGAHSVSGGGHHHGVVSKTKHALAATAALPEAAELHHLVQRNPQQPGASAVLLQAISSHRHAAAKYCRRLVLQSVQPVFQFALSSDSKISPETLQTALVVEEDEEGEAGRPHNKKGGDGPLTITDSATVGGGLAAVSGSMVVAPLGSPAATGAALLSSSSSGAGGGGYVPDHIAPLLRQYTDSQEQRRRLLYRIEELQAEQQRAAADGDVTTLEAVANAQLSTAQHCQRAAVLQLEPLTTLQTTVVEGPRVAIRGAVKQSLDQFIPHAKEKLKREIALRKQLLTQFTENEASLVDAFVRQAFVESQDAVKSAAEVQACQQEEQQLLLQLQEVVQRLQRVRSQKYQAVKHMHEVSERRIASFATHHHARAQLQFQRCCGAAELQILEKGAVAFEQDIPKWVQTVAEHEEASLMRCQHIVFDAQKHAHLAHHRALRQVALATESLASRKEGALRLLAAKHDAVSMELEMASDDLDSVAGRRAAQAKKELHEMITALSQEVDLTRALAICSKEVFAERGSKEFLLQIHAKEAEVDVIAEAKKICGDRVLQVTAAAGARQ